jgi:glycosyltransferase involved in cell wall biosynthesis
LLIAGRRTEDPGVAELMERAALHPSVLIHPRPFEPGEVQVFLRAADLAVQPYPEALNSGSLLLSLTFGLPSIVPSDGGLAEVVDQRSGVTFDPARPDDLERALREAQALAGPAGRAAALEVAARHDPDALSDRFALELRRVLG